jgi:hypothetical protein
MINPAWADAIIDDRTITKLIGFGKRRKWGKLIVGNVFAQRTQFVREIEEPSLEIENENLRHIKQIMSDAQVHIVAWGLLAKFPEQHREKWKLISETAKSGGFNLMCFGTNLDGHPTHPGRISYETSLEPWVEPAK